MKHGAPELVKFKKLQRRLGLAKRRDVVGLLESLWLLTQREAKRGDIGRLDNETIAIELEWDGDPDELIAAMVATGWLDEHPECRLVVHDWRDHAPRYVHGCVSKMGGFAGTSPTIETDYSDSLETATNQENVADCTGQEPNLTKPNLTKPPPPTPTANTDAVAKATPPDWVVVEEELLKIGLGAARSVAKKARKRGFRPEVVIGYATHYANHWWAWEAGAVAHVLAESPANCPPHDAIWPQPREPDAECKRAMAIAADMRKFANEKGKQVTEEQFAIALRDQLEKQSLGHRTTEVLWRQRSPPKSKVRKP